MGRFTTRSREERNPTLKKDNEDLYWKVVRGKKNSSLEILLLGLLSICIGIFFFLVFFRG